MTNKNNQFEALKEIIFNTPITNESKIQFLKEEIAANRYEIDSNRIAAKLMEDIQRTEQATTAEEIE